MATRKTQPVETEEEVQTTETEEEVQTTETEEEVQTTETVEEVKVKAEKDPWEEEMEVFVPRAGRGEDDFKYVCVNDRRYSIPRNGKTHKVPRPIGEVLKMSLEAEAKAQEYLESIHVNEAEPIRIL